MGASALSCVLFVLGACSFDSDYRGGDYKCSDGRCPSGLICDRAADRCRAPGDGPIDGEIDAAIDAPEDSHALNCADPGVIASTGGTAKGSTTGRTSLMTASCGGSVMTAPDAVYRLTAAAGDQFLINITYLKAYALTACMPAPATPSCVGNTAAAPDDPILVTAAAAGPLYIVVDHEFPSMAGAYELTVTKQ